MKGLWHAMAASGKVEWNDADTFEMDPGGWGFGRRPGGRELVSCAADDPRRLDHSGRGNEILDDAQAHGIPQSRQGLQYRMDAIPGHRADDAGAGRGRPRLRDAGAIVTCQWRGRRKSEGLYRGAARLRKARRF